MIRSINPLPEYFPYINVAYAVTSEFGSIEYGRSAKHRGVDIAVPQGTAIHIERESHVSWHLRFRYRVSHVGQVDGKPPWFTFANYFYDQYGLFAVVHDGQLQHLFAHLDPAMTLTKVIGMEQSVDSAKFPKLQENTVIRDLGYIDCYTWKSHLTMEGGAPCIGYVGVSGVSTGPHVHYEAHPAQTTKHSPINPRDVWRFRDAV